jgi:hypothetical protein
MQDRTPFARSTSTTTEPMSPNAVSEEVVRGRNISCCLLALAASTSTLAATTITNTKKKSDVKPKFIQKRANQKRHYLVHANLYSMAMEVVKGRLIATSSLSCTSSIAEISTQIRQQRQKNLHRALS